MGKFRRTKHKYKKRRFSSTQLISSAFLIMACGISAWFFYEVSYIKPADDWFEIKATSDISVSLPRDDAPHQAAMEWWYYNGHLRSESGNRFSFHYTVFLVQNVAAHTVSHVSLNDHQTGKHYTAQRRTGGNSSANIENRFEFIQGDWLMAGENGDDRLRIVAEDFSFDLNLTSTQEPVFHGDDGVILLGIAGDSYYYSRTRMAVSGTVKIGNTVEKITGISWFDHQWGDFSVGLLSWDWFSLQLNGGVDVMIYQLRDKYNKPILYMGSFSQNGMTESLLDTDFSTTPGKKWTSSKSKIDYPIEWKIEIPKKNINIAVKSINNNSEFDAKLTSYNIYWEGSVKVQGSHSGLGFMELYYMDKRD